MEPRSAHDHRKDDLDEDSVGAALHAEKWEESGTHFQANSPSMSSLLFDNLEQVGILEERASRTPSPETSHGHSHGKSVYGRPSPLVLSPQLGDYAYGKISPSMSPTHFASSPEEISHGNGSTPSMSPLSPGNHREGNASSATSPRIPEEFSYGRALDDRTSTLMSPIPSMSPRLFDHTKVSSSTSLLPPSGHRKISEERELLQTSLLQSEEGQMKESASESANGTEFESLKTEVLENKSISQAESSKDVTVLSDMKITTNKSLSTPIPTFSQAVFNAVKKLSSTTKSFSSRPSPTLYGSTYGTKIWLPRTSNKSKIIQLVLRTGGAVLSLIAFAVMASTNQQCSGAGSTFMAKFRDFGAYSYLVAMNILYFLYSGWHLLQLGQPSSSRVVSSFRFRLHIYICDQIAALLLLSASSSAATASQLSRHGLHNIWPPACSTWALWFFCSKVDVAVVVSFFSAILAISAAIFSGYELSNPFED